MPAASLARISGRCLVARSFSSFAGIDTESTEGGEVRLRSSMGPVWERSLCSEVAIVRFCRMGLNIISIGGCGKPGKVQPLALLVQGTRAGGGAEGMPWQTSETIREKARSGPTGSTQASNEQTLEVDRVS
jgi:hypothetical protein